jgi:phosphoribosylglycinamide formyltransferase-1
MRPRITVFASGTKDGGGSGFENLVRASYDGRLDADIVAVVSNHKHGGVRERAERLGIPCVYCNTADNSYCYIINNITIQKASIAELYRAIVEHTGAQWVALSGWLKKVEGLDPAKTFNIHPALLSQLDGRFGGHGMWGHHIHEAVKVAYDAGEISETGFTMHFVTDEFDRGPIFFEHHIPMTKNMSVDDIAAAVNKAEHEWQPIVTNDVVHGRICWDGVHPGSLEGARSQ